MSRVSLQGAAEVIGQDLFTSSSTQQHPIGEMATTSDGCIYRYTKNGASAMVAGKLYQGAAEDTTNQQDLTVTNATLGDTSITTTTTVTLAANLLAGGYLVVTAGTLGVGQTYRIKGNTAASAAVVTFYLEDAVRVTMTGTCKVDVYPNPYAGVVVAPTSATGAPVGVAIHPVAASEYGWLLTHGPAAILAQGTVTVGDMIIPANTTTTGTVVAEGANTIDAGVGFALTGIASTEFGLAFFNID